MAVSKKGVSTLDKFRISGGSRSVIVSVTRRKLFCVMCKHCIENKRRYCKRFSNWAKKFTARQWAALIGFCGVETRKQVQNIWKKIEKYHDEKEVRTIVVTSIEEQQVDVDRQSIWV